VSGDTLEPFPGETAGKLRLLFDQIAETRGVYLLDGFDAIDAQRGSPNDTGEIRRTLNSILTFMEEPNATDSLVLAATNHAEILDESIACHFDEFIEYGLPDTTSGCAIIKRRLGKFKIAAEAWPLVEAVVENLTPGELVRAADGVVKDAILEGSSSISSDTLCAALESRQSFRARLRSPSNRQASATIFD